MDITILSARGQPEIKHLMHEIGVDSRGIRIMAPKAVSYLIKINKLNNIAANILKQETLSIGADTAVSKDTLTGKIKHTDCLIIANLLQLGRLCDKLKTQPYGLNEISVKIKAAISNYTKRDFVLETKSYKLSLGARTHIMGILNITPDSFSGDGLYKQHGIDGIIDFANQMVENGADILDIGGESSRPGAKAISLKEELIRVIPVIKALRKKIKIPISIDTYKSEVARQALDNGAQIVNDISALSGSRDMAKTIQKYNCPVILMHAQGTPANMQRNPQYKDVTGEIIAYLKNKIDFCIQKGIKPDKIIIDPGIGFGKTAEHNLTIIKNLQEFKALGRPILIGASRKSFIGKILGNQPKERLFGTLASICMSVLNGANIARVHDVKETKETLKVIDRVKKC